MRLKRFVHEYTKTRPFFADLSLRVIAPTLLCTVIGQLREAMIDSIYLFDYWLTCTPEAAPSARIVFIRDHVIEHPLDCLVNNE